MSVAYARPCFRVARVLPSTACLSATRRACASSSAAAPEKSKNGLPKDGLTLEDFLPSKAEGAMGSAMARLGHAPTDAMSAPTKSGALQRQPKPKWLKMYNPNTTQEGGERYRHLKATVKDLGLATVCQEAKCPNVGECWSSGSATVMIMGDTCTRGCRFCSVATSRTPPPPDSDEPEKVATAVKKWGLDYVVLTMVDRDDLADQGANHVAATVSNLKQGSSIMVETLIGDFQGKLELIAKVVESGMNVFAHNLETVERLQSTVRDRRAGYEQSLEVLRHAKRVRPDIVTKSALMLGLGETRDEIERTVQDMKAAGVDIVTFGQYLQPTKRHMKVVRYVTPEEFDEIGKMAEDYGLHCASGPLVRSSYKAKELYEARVEKRRAAGLAETGSPLPEIDTMAGSLQAARM
mmetsp:Transcript_6170/g.10741  ORF Transcript_6170/g.10741 Transcript_6170/m.10741 type:complete len:408 (+) Transcript_6170:58-1281(+)